MNQSPRAEGGHRAGGFGTAPGPAGTDAAGRGHGEGSPPAPSRPGEPPAGPTPGSWHPHPHPTHRHLHPIPPHPTQSPLPSRHALGSTSPPQGWIPPASHAGGAGDRLFVGSTGAPWQGRSMKATYPAVPSQTGRRGISSDVSCHRHVLRHWIGVPRPAQPLPSPVSPVRSLPPPQAPAGLRTRRCSPGGSGCREGRAGCRGGRGSRLAGRTARPRPAPAQQGSCSQGCRARPGRGRSCPHPGAARRRSGHRDGHTPGTAAPRCTARLRGRIRGGH